MKEGTVSHCHKLVDVEWLFEELEIEAISRLEGKWEADSGIEFRFNSDGVNPPITLQIMPILEEGAPKLDFVITRHYPVK